MASVDEDDSSLDESQELYLNKTGRPLKLGEELHKQLREYIRDLRAKGLAINTAVVIASTEGILMHKDVNLLQQFNLTEGWAKYTVVATTNGVCEEKGDNYM